MAAALKLFHSGTGRVVLRTEPRGGSRAPSRDAKCGAEGAL